MRVTSARNERLKRVRLLARDASERRERGECVIEGVRIATEYLRGAGPVRLAVVSPSLESHAGGPALRAAIDEALVDRPDDLLETDDGILTVTGDARTSQGVILVVPLSLRGGLPPADGRAALVAWEMQDPGNVGTLVRIAEASGCGAMVLARAPGGAAADPFSPRAVRASAGSCFRVPVHAWTGTADALRNELLGAGFHVAACVARGGVAPEEADLSGSCAIVIGSEAHGVPEALSPPLTQGVTIPLEGAAESLNAAAAAAVACFESARRRRG